MAKKPSSQKSSAIVVTNPKQALERIDESRRLVNHALQNLATTLTGVVMPEALAPALTTIRETEKTLEGLGGVAKSLTIHILKDAGELVEGTKGTYRYVIGDDVLSMRPTRTGTDPKKLEAWLRARNLEPSKYMDATVTYKTSELGTQQLLKEGQLTHDDLEELEYDESWAVMAPSKLKE